MLGPYRGLPPAVRTEPVRANTGPFLGRNSPYAVVPDRRLVGGARRTLAA
jgi:hypothetical protein